ncbi:hypothetical protein TRFO_12052 [Tritrichomonas foetus]|uniref:Anaphase-promoting complex subunit 1 n=1 Tax=Tritrichomonas foetus TaxID=1144522 RepID=A0A1J4J4G8_9EUKA|nr:hypothetical protein TRFO_12052 [Tritrichomonas foetus]|eukprot:OHS93047.1 hypothetical protein TRFO_12052 [Tritrichomonas foetus]
MPDSEPSGRTSFLHKKDNLNYQILHIIGNKVMNFRASYRNKKVDVKHLKDGINLNNCKKWFFSQKDYTFYALLNNNAFIVYSCTEKGLRVEKYNYFYDESTILPNELALIPSTLTNHPYFRFSSGISYILKLKYENYTDYGIIEQLYQNDESQLSFVVSTIHKKFRKVVSVPRVQSDLPISFISHEKVVFAFVPNCFVAMIDFSLQHPHISIMPRSLSKSESSMFSTSIGSSNFITDLDSGKLFNCYLSLHEIPNTLNFGDRTIISILARITASLPKYISIPAIIDHLPNDISLVQYYFLNVFNFIKQTTPPTQIVLKSNIRRKSEVPQNKTSLLSFFKKSNTKNNDRRQSDDKCIYLESEGESGSGFSEGNKENKRVNLLEEIQESIFSWKSEKTPSKSNIFSVELSSIYEAKLLDIKDFPVDLIYECTQNVEKLCPVTIKHHLTANKVINCLSSSKEADFWSSRFLDEENPNSQPNSKPNSSQNSMKMKTVDLKKKRENRKKNKIEKNLINKEGIKEALTSFPLKNIDQLDMLPKTNYLCVKSV